MPRNGTGTYSLPSGINPVTDGTVIDANWANTTLTDLAVATTGSMPRDGQAPMTGPLKLADGSVSTPSLSWNADSTTGFYRPGTGSLAISVGGIEQVRFTAGNLLLGTTTNTGAKLNVVGDSSLTGAVTITGQSTFVGTAIHSTLEAIRLTNGTGYIAGFNSDNTTRQGYLQFNTGGAINLAAEGVNFVQLTSAGGSFKVLTSGEAAASAVLTANNTLDSQVQIGVSPLGSIEIGKAGRTTAGTPAIDFHSSTNNIDYDARIVASGGTATVGKGLLMLQGAQIHTDGGSSLKYYNSGTTNALDYNNGNHQRWTPAAGAQTLSVTNWPASGRLGMLLVDGVNLGAATITWPAGTRFIKSDGTETTTFSSLGITLQSAGTDRVFLWTFDGGANVYVRVMR